MTRLPTLWESSSPYWHTGESFPDTVNPLPHRVTTDLWRGPDGIIPGTGASYLESVANANLYRVSNPWHPDLWTPQTRLARFWDDVILADVLAFDVKVWDAGAPWFSRTVRGPGGVRTVVVRPGDPGYPRPDTPAAGLTMPVGYGAYVDLGYLPNYTARPGVPRPRFHVGNYDVPNGPRSGLYRVYDTWSTHYEYDGISQFGRGPDWATDGIDNDGKNGVDDDGERETKPPYPFPLRSIQVKIRAFDPDSRQIRDVTIVQNFMPQ